MKRFLHKIQFYLFGEIKDISLELRIFLIVILSLISIAIAGNIVNIILNFCIELIVTTFLAIILTSFFFIKVRNSKNYKNYVILASLLCLIFLILHWIMNGGYEGNTINLFFVIFIGMYISIQRNYRVILSISFLISLAGLIMIQHYKPEFIVPYQNEQQRFVDLLAGNIIYFIVMIIIINSILSSYNAENRKFREANEELKIKNREIAISSMLIKENEEKFRRIAEQVPDAIFLTDNFGNITYMSPASEKVIGIKEEDMMNKSIIEIIPEKDKNKVLEKFKKTLGGEATSELPIEIIRKDGSRQHVELNISIYHEQSEIVGTIGIIRDVTERNTAAEEILILSKVVGQSPASIMITDVSGNIEYVNSKFSEITGYSSDEAFGKKPNILKSGFLTNEFYRELWTTILAGKEWRGEMYNKKKNGEFFWENASIFPIKNDEDEITHFIALKQDITEKKMMMEELIEAKERAEESDRLKSAFLANMSHEIRTPLNGIIGFSKLLGKETLSKTNRDKYFNIVNKNTDTLLNIINDILDMSRIESGQLEIVKQEFVVNNVLSELFTQFLQKIRTENKEVQLITPSIKDKIIIISDESRVRQIFINLLDNAIKYTYKGTVEFGILKMDQKYLHFFVRDTGKGISTDQHSIIFNRFRQVEVKSNKQSGNGLGLAIVKQLLELMNGDIKLTSEIDKGSEFVFWIPKK